MFTDVVNQLVFFWVYVICGMRFVQGSAPNIGKSTSTTRRIKAKYDNPYQNWCIKGCHMGICTGFMWLRKNDVWSVFRTWFLLGEEYFGQMNTHKLIDKCPVPSDISILVTLVVAYVDKVQNSLFNEKAIHELDVWGTKMGHAAGGTVRWGTALQAGRSGVPFPMVSLDFSLT